jgi:transcriptional regulator with XRE-family HTH domain
MVAMSQKLKTWQQTGRPGEESSAGTGKIKSLWRRLTNREYRNAYIESKVANDIAFQVFYLREQRGLTQGALAELAGAQQPQISRIERSTSLPNVSTLLKVASALDVALSIKFVSFNTLIGEETDSELSASIPSFEQDRAPLGSAPIIRLAPASGDTSVCDETNSAGDASAFVFTDATSAPLENSYVIN